MEHNRPGCVPLLLHLPGGFDEAPRRISTHVTTLDVVPTLRGILGLAPSEQDQGRDLLAEAPPSERPIYGLLEGKSGQHALQGDLRSIVLGDHRLIVSEAGAVELFDLSADPLERHDLAGELPDVVALLLCELERIEQSSPALRPPHPHP